jgi:6-phosphogluconolactonase
MTLNRRKLLALLPAAATALHSPLMAQKLFTRKRKQPPAPIQPLVYIGTDTINSSAKGVYVARFNPATGQLSNPKLAVETVRPSFLASAHVGKRQLLYAANEGQDEKSSGISSFLIDPATGALSPLNKVSAGGSGPCYVSVNATGTAAFCADYAGSAVASFQVKPDGTLTEPVSRLDFRQPVFGHHGPNTARQDASHPHSATLSPDNRFLVVNDLGNDDIVTFYIHPETAKLGPPQLNPVHVPGTGPRHIAFHPNDRWAYGIDELSNYIDHYLWNTTHATGSAEPVALLTHAGNSVSTVDPGFHGANTAAEIVISPEGDYVLCSNRGENSLVVFHIDAVTGAPTFVQRVSCGGKSPRQFTLDPSGRWLLCGNQDSNTITIFSRNEATGHLSGPVQTLPVDMPQMILFA